MSVRDTIRSHTIGAKKNFRTEIVKWGEDEVEIRQPSVKERRRLLKQVTNQDGMIDGQELLIWAVITQTFIPGTNERVFDDTDYDALLELPTGGFLDEFGQVALEVMNVEEPEKNSETSEETEDSKTS